MSEAWERDQWRLDEARSRRLPQVEDLPRSGDGYDRAAVEAAFESFYRHAAEMDRTLEVLESVAAFQREAGALRSDIRALRAASWGPVPTLRHTVATTAVGRVERGVGPFHAWPRIALYSAFIIFVAVGSAVADLSSGAIVALVLASWLVVGVAELAVSGVGSRMGRAPRGYPEFAAEERALEAAEPEPAAAVVVEPVPEPTADEPDKIEEEPEPVADEAEEEAQPQPAVAWAPWPRQEAAERPVRDSGSVEGVRGNREVPPATEEAVEEPPDEELEPAADEEPEDVQPQAVPAPEPFGASPEPAPEPVEIVPEVEPLEEAAQPPVRESEPVEGFPGSREVPPTTEESDGKPDLEPAAAPGSEPTLEPEPEEEPQPAPAAAEVERGKRLRFWRRRTVVAAAALEPLPEPRHVRLVEVEESDEPEREAAQPPVRESGPVEGVWGNREVPPATEEAVEEAEPTQEATEEELNEAEEEPEAPEEAPEAEETDETLAETGEQPAVAAAAAPFTATPQQLRLRRGRR